MHLASLRTQGAHRGIPGSHLDFRCQEHESVDGIASDGRLDGTCLHLVQAVSVCAMRPSGGSRVYDSPGDCCPATPGEVPVRDWAMALVLARTSEDAQHC
jgi:hypothetical protein